MLQYHFIKEANVRQGVKECGKRCSKKFLAALDRDIFDRIKKCCSYDRNQKTLDETAVTFTR